MCMVLQIKCPHKTIRHLRVSSKDNFRCLNPLFNDISSRKRTLSRSCESSNRLTISPGFYHSSLPLFTGQCWKQIPQHNRRLGNNLVVIQLIPRCTMTGMLRQEARHYLVWYWRIFMEKTRGSLIYNWRCSLDKYDHEFIMYPYHMQIL